MIKGKPRFNIKEQKRKKHEDDDAIKHKCFYMKQHEQKQ
jgi:hypothetical protein